jgi:hypothetical protein
MDQHVNYLSCDVLITREMLLAFRIYYCKDE